MVKIYSYVLRHDDGAAPNPFWGICTLTICKPAIRRNAQVGDWVIGTGSKNSKLKDGIMHDFSEKLVYAMKVTQNPTLAKYDEICLENWINKIPDWYHKDWRMRMGDCIYDFSKDENPLMRKGVHGELNKPKDISGRNSLISDYFFYFGEKPITIPKKLLSIIKHNQGHKKIENLHLISIFEKWIEKRTKNKIYADPQLRWKFDKKPSDRQIILCSKQHFKNDEDESEETIC